MASIGKAKENFSKKLLNLLMENEVPGQWALLFPFLFGIAFLAMSFFLLEKIDSYYFVQDDNFAQFFPVILDACRSLFHNGLFPTMNPYQYGGVPTTALGTYALSYPLTYLSYGVAAFILRNEFLMLEVFAFVHLAIGYGACLMIFRQKGISLSLAVLGGLSFVLSGYFLIAGRSWYYMLPVAAYMPILVLLIEKFRLDYTDWKWSLWTGGVIGLAFHSGNVQMWFYTLIFFCLSLGLMIVLDKALRKKSFYVGAALLIGAGWAMPLLLWTMRLTQNLARGPWGHGILKGLAAMFLPYPLVQAAHPEKWGNSSLGAEYAGHLYYNGSFFNLSFVIVCVLFILFLISYRRDKGMICQFLIKNIWVVMGIIAFVLALGPQAGLWSLLAHVPPFNKFSLPFKFLPFVHFFFILGAISMINQLFLKRKIKKVLPFLYLFLFALLLYHVNSSKSSFWFYADDPYPDLPQEMQQALSAQNQEYPQRMHTRSFLRSKERGFSQGLGLNFPTVYRVLSVEGYETLIEKPKFNKDVLFDYGVKYIVESPFKGSLGTTDPVLDAPIIAQKRYSFANMYLLSGASPLAFVQKQPQVALPISFDVQGAVVNTLLLRAPLDIVVNMVFREGFRAFANSQELMVKADDKGRIVIKHCPPALQVKVRYYPSLVLGFLLSGACFLAAGGILFLTRFKKL